MTPDRLREIVTRLGAVVVDGDLLAPCPLHQPDCDELHRYKLVLSPGYKTAIVACCRVCGWSDPKWLRRFWESVGVQYGELQLTGGLTESRELWARAGTKFSVGWSVDSFRATAETLPDDRLHAVYSDLLQALPLTDRHSKWLEKRGLSNGRGMGYGSGAGGVVVGELNGLLRAKWGDDVLSRVPGFGDRCGVRDNCILTPVRNVKGEIVAVKQRILDGGKGRMRMLAGGPRNRSRCHCPLGVGGRLWDRVWVTEGERKADVWWTRTGTATVGIPGVASGVTAVDILTGLGCREVVVALDRDAAGVKASGRVCGLLAAKGFTVYGAVWSGAKGLDDAAVKGVEVQTEKYDPHPTENLVKVAGSEKARGGSIQNDDLIPYLRANGPQLRDSMRCYQAYLSDLIRSGEVVMRKTATQGQVVGVKGDGQRVLEKVRGVNGGG